jgi:hypothetical protein
MYINVFYKISTSIAYLSLGVMVLLPALVYAEAKTPEASDSKDLFASVLDSRVSRYKKSLAQLAEDPVIIAAVREYNKKGNAGNMNNSEWTALAEDDPKVLRLNKNETGEFLGKFEKSRAFEKLNVRDAKGNLVVFSSNSMKPLVYNAADRPGFMNGLKGVWSDSAIKPDPTTLKMAVQIAAPIKDEGKVIGVIHSSVTAE